MTFPSKISAHTDALVAALKTCLRTSNQHLTLATLSALLPFLPLVALPQVSSSATSNGSGPPFSNSHTIRQTFLAFLPTGGVIDRLGEGREKVRDVAREVLVVMGGIALKTSATGINIKGKDTLSKAQQGPETPLAIFERLLRELGLSSKVWRVREQVCLSLCTYGTV